MSQELRGAPHGGAATNTDAERFTPHARAAVNSMAAGEDAAAMAATSTDAAANAAAGPVYAAVTQKLTAAFAPLAHLQVLNESSAHNVAPGSDTHFKVVVISDAFASVAPLERHRMINATLAAELAGPIHALSIVAKTPKQWERSAAVPESPLCMGGSKR